MVCFFVITPSMIAISMFPLLMTVASDTDRTWMNIIEQKIGFIYDLPMHCTCTKNSFRIHSRLLYAKSSQFTQTAGLYA